jgi:hypothetical protein
MSELSPVVADALYEGSRIVFDIRATFVPGGATFIYFVA